jgi:DNA-binding response OmpR family regulator
MKRILALAIDDEPGFLLGLQRAMTAEGIDVVPADDLATGVREMAERDFDCVLLDLNLGNDSQGIATFWKFKASTRKRVPVVVLSGDVSQAMELELAHIGVRVVHKPFMDGLADTIRAVIDEHEQEQSATRSQSPHGGTISPQWVTALREEVRSVVAPLSHDVERLIAWMNASLAADAVKEKAKVDSDKPKPKKTPWEALVGHDWARSAKKAGQLALLVAAIVGGSVAGVRWGMTWHAPAAFTQQH